MVKSKISDLTISELVDLEKAATIICKNYENGVKMYNGTINTLTSEYKNFDDFNNIRISILKEIENRLKQIE